MCVATTANWVLFLVLIIIANLASLTSALLCYRCDSTIQTQKGALLCSDFDYSDRFIVECNNSTFCMKKDYTVNLKVPINGTVRGCANQLYETMQFVDNTWHSKSIVEEAYSERCIPLDDKGFRSSKTTYCFCKGDLCNTGARQTKNVFIISVILCCTFLFLN